MSRIHIVKIHTFLATLFLPFALLLPLTGVSYLLGFKGDVVKTEAFKLVTQLPEDESEQIQMFRNTLLQHDFTFEKMVFKDGEYIFRPTSRPYYSAKVTQENEVTFFKNEPSLMKRLLEVHKGHGPARLRYLEIAFGIALLIISFSGLWLALSLKAYCKISVVGLTLGALLLMSSFLF